MTGKTLKGALFLAIALCLALSGALAFVVLHGHPFFNTGHRTSEPHSTNEGDPVVARGPAVSATPAATPVDSQETSLAPIQISPQRLQEIGVTTTLVERKNVADTLQATGTVAMDERRISYVQTRFPGWIRTVFANATYQYVKKGQKLFTIYSPDLAGTEQEYLLARQNQQVSSMHMHGAAAQEGNWLLQAAEERLRRFDIPDSEIKALAESGTVSKEIAIDSPASGYILERNALPNAYVQPETRLYTIADLGTVWVIANVPQIDVGRLKSGTPAEVTVDAYPDRKFRGRVSQILPDVDAATRTVRVRLVFSNPGIVLKPGMYVNVTLAAPLGPQLVIPTSGVLQAGARQIAYIDRGNGSLEPREIETGAKLDNFVIVLKGLRAGDRIVSSANFLVDSEAQLQTMSGAPESAGQPTSTAAQPGQPHIDLATDPSPPHRGANVLRVSLKGQDGKPLSGAQVSVTFFMPAMPAMGMAAMRTVSQLDEKSVGEYQGRVQLDTGGTWNVTVTAMRGGQTIATRTLSLNATGGMQ